MDIKDLENKMKAAMVDVKECVDMSFQLMQEDPESKKVVYRYWEGFLVHFMDYIRKQEKETRVEILKGIPLAKLLKFMK